MSDFPCLHRPDTGQRVAVPRGDAELLVGRSSEATFHIPSRQCSRRQVRLVVRAGHAYLEPLSASVPTSVNGRPVRVEVPLGHGARIEFGDVVIEYLDPPRAPAAVPASVPTDADLGHGEMTRVEGFRIDDVVAEAGQTVTLSGSGVIGRAADATYRLDHPSVSRRHAQITISGDRVSLEDLGSANGTYVNGEHSRRRRDLEPGDRVDIGPFSLEFRGDRFVQTSRRGNLRLVAKGLTRRVVDRSGGGTLTILDDVSLVIPPREFVALIGPSGSGKSTLMNALSARAPADEGQVLVNEVDLYANFESLKANMAMVHQDEALHTSLEVQEAVGYTARLRLPPDTDRAGIASAVRAALEEVDLTERASTEVGNLSGGQRKRACLANETVHDPSLLFVDEATSGLDEQTDREVMRLLRRSAEVGRTVVCVTHTLANVEEFCHKIVVMYGGVLAFYGSPAECLEYFEVERISDVYRVLADRDAATWRGAYRASPYHAAHIGEIEDEARPTGAGRPQDIRAVGKELRRRVPEMRRQFLILTQRANRLLLRDRRTLGIAAAQALTIGAVLALVFGGLDLGVLEEGRRLYTGPDGLVVGGKPRSLLFMLGISCFWFGTSNASKEIVRERLIYLRERDVNLSVPSYLLSKLVGLSLLGLLQSTALFAVVWILATVPGNDLYELALMFGAVLCGTALGLLISTSTSSQEQATTVVPIVLIPQIVMAGVIVPNMPALAEFFARVFVSGYWITEGMTPDVESVLAAGVTPQLAGATAVVTYPGLAGTLTGLLVLGLHFLVFLGTSLVVLVTRDSRGETLYGAALEKWVENAKALRRRTASSS